MKTMPTEMLSQRIVIEALLAEIPVYQYAFVETSSLEFSSKVRAYCRNECPFYGTSWSCPPAAGRLDRARQRCLAFPEALVFSTLHPEEGDPEERRIRRRDHAHEDITRQVEDAILSADFDVYTLGGSVCSICADCAFPRESCRHLSRMHRCIESAGLVLPDIAETCNMDYYLGETWRLSFSIGFYRRRTENPL